MRAGVEEKLDGICGGDINDGGRRSESAETVADVGAYSVDGVGGEVREYKGRFERKDVVTLWRRKVSTGEGR